ncbi:hypothetical protein [Amycolatopsis regifaucium]|uniref:WXG100 family type VII secretion target n=1 Tax=Amycolatopsis regifaucium TaxID=546365 RepID=A0A154M914_9PSEU|nr:hypothetical protein [Amycolatopsis regifaucium]KZB80807.1 hypothetical protein AVL48_37900 [Amycolatopsis regifaucium]OKA03132.1 hypothetical protein ATP06_0237755 [Amycolatopsis regifaucium]
MAHSTKLNDQDIIAQAARHEETANNVNDQLDNLKREVEATLAASTSAATRALSSVTGEWVEAVRKTVLSNLNGMAGDMRREAGAQVDTDADNTQSILNVPMGTSTFLGA